jgi:hypothetical protein
MHGTPFERAEKYISLALLAAATVLLSSLWMTPSEGSRFARLRAHAADIRPRNEPLRVSGATKHLIPLSTDEYRVLSALVQPPRKHGRLTNSYLLHLLRVHGLDEQLQGSELRSGEQIKIALTGDDLGRRLLGNSPLARTPYGLRYPTREQTSIEMDRSLEEHRDQVLASLGELGLPLSQPIVSGQSKGSLRQVLEDSVANFYLKQRELAWTTLAYSLYLPPQKSWTNRFGETFTFDDLASAMMDVRLDEQSCAGTHSLYSLTILARVDRQSPVLSDTVRVRLGNRLERAVAAAVHAQDADGSWHPGWNRDLLPEGVPRFWSPVDDARNRLIATGHLAEWFLYLPAELAPPDRVLIRAAGWIRTKLLAATADDVEQSFCPYTHAACLLRRVAYANLSPGSTLSRSQPP